MANRRDFRTAEQLREHYVVERELADRLRCAGAEERLRLYTAVYDELFHRVEHHPMRRASLEHNHDVAAIQIRLLRRLLRPDMTYLEIGPGDCIVARFAASIVKLVYAVDVSHCLSSSAEIPSNFHLITSDGKSVPVPPGSVDLAFSNQVMEHLHPDDAIEQIQNIYRALSVGGRYLCITPSRLTGPHDISRYFERGEAAGLHLKEYTISELTSLFRRAGFRQVRAFPGFRSYGVESPVWPLLLLDRLFSSLPLRWARPIASILPLRVLLNVRLIATK